MHMITSVGALVLISIFTRVRGSPLQTSYSKQPGVGPLAINDIGDLESPPGPMSGPLFAASDQVLLANNLTRLVLKTDACTFNVFAYNNISKDASIPNYYRADGTKIDSTLGAIEADMEATSKEDEPKLISALLSGVGDLQRQVNQTLDNRTGPPSVGVSRRQVQNHQWPRIRFLDLSVLLLAGFTAPLLRAAVSAAAEADRPHVTRPSGELSSNLAMALVLCLGVMIGAIQDEVRRNGMPLFLSRASYLTAWLFISGLLSLYNMARFTIGQGVGNNIFPSDQDVQNVLAPLYGGNIGGNQGGLAAPVVDDRLAELLLNHAVPAG